MKRLFGHGASLSYIKAKTKENEMDYVPVVNLKMIYIQEGIGYRKNNISDKLEISIVEEFATDDIQFTIEQSPTVIAILENIITSIKKLDNEAKGIEPEQKLEQTEVIDNSQIN